MIYDCLVESEQQLRDHNWLLNCSVGYTMLLCCNKPYFALIKTTSSNLIFVEMHR